jgi:hypothetical protein
MVEFKQNAEGFNGEFNLHTIGPDDFKATMVTYFAHKGFTPSATLNQRHGVELVPL